MAKRSIVDDIAAAIPEGCSSKPWWQRINAKQKKFIKPILDGWRAGTFGHRRITAARVISDHLAKNGISIGPQGVQNWLLRG
jgi:hypothetical protein